MRVSRNIDFPPPPVPCPSHGPAVPGLKTAHVASRVAAKLEGISVVSSLATEVDLNATELAEALCPESRCVGDFRSIDAATNLAWVMATYLAAAAAAAILVADFLCKGTSQLRRSRAGAALNVM